MTVAPTTSSTWGKCYGRAKFYCKGVEQASGRRVAVTLSADNKESAVRLLRSTAFWSSPSCRPRTPGRPPAAACRRRAWTKNVNGLLDSPDDEAEGLDLAAAAKPTSPASPATKSCPYCGERVLAVAIRCKHCGSYLAEEQQEVRRPVQDAPPRAAMPPRAWVAIAVVAGIVLIAAVLWKVLFNSPVPAGPGPPVACRRRRRPRPLRQSRRSQSRRRKRGRSP